MPKGRNSRKNKDRGRLAGLREAFEPGTPGRRAVQATGWILAIAGVAVGITYGVPELERRATARDMAIEHEIDVRFPDSGWFHGQSDYWLDRVHGEVHRVVRETLSRHPRTTHEQAGLREAHQVLVDSGWFDRVDQVRWHDARTVVVEGIWATPAAWVEGRLDGERRDILVDSRGRRLPLDGEPADRSPRISGTALDRVPAIGESFGEAVQAGIALHGVLAEFDWSDQISDIDVSEFSSPIRGLVIHTNDGCSIVWGEGPDVVVDATETTVTQKLQYLDDLDARWGRIDAPCSRNGGLGEIDLRMDFATYRAIEEARRRTTQ